MRKALTFLFLVLALSCYLFGVPAGGVLFLILGGIFELLFWAGVLGSSGKAEANPTNN